MCSSSRALRLVLLFLAVANVLAADWRPAGPGARVQLVSPRPGAIGFTRVLGPEVGVTFTNQLSLERMTTNQIILNGSGVAAGDFDNDGWCDLYLCGLDNRNGLYRNLGNFRFADVTATAGVAMEGTSSAGAAFADMDGDGDLDLLVTTVGQGLRYFQNDGRGKFTDRTDAAGMRTALGGTSLGIADLEGDGDLDVYFATYRTSSLRDEPGTNFRMSMVNGAPGIASVNGVPITAPQLEGRFKYDPKKGIHEFGEPDYLYVNDGTGKFERHDVGGPRFLDEAGQPLPKLYEWGLSVMFRDLNGDQRPDLYVCNDFDEPDRIWLNTGDGRFRAIAQTAIRSTPKFSMGVDVADINRDGHDDLFALDMLPRKHETWIRRQTKRGDLPTPGQPDERLQIFRNTLHLNRGDGTYAEIAQLAGVEASEWAWTAIFVDVDLDGHEDLLISNGHGRDDMDWDAGLKMAERKKARKLSPAEDLALRRDIPPYNAKKVAFRNLGNLRFEEVGDLWNFANEGITHGMCLADLDNDGDQEVVVNALNAPVEIFRNDSTAPRVAIRLKAGKNSHGIGGRIVVDAPGMPSQSQVVIAGGRYLSSDQPLRTFAAGTNGMVAINVSWPDGTTSEVRDVHGNSIVEIEPSAARKTEKTVVAEVAPILVDESSLLGSSHMDTPFEDFQVQPLLPYRLSQAGPGVAWFDFNGDGLDDLAIGSGRGGPLTLFSNAAGARFHRVQALPFAAVVARDQMGLFGFASAARLLAGSANYEDGSPLGSPVRVFESGKAAAQDIFPLMRSSAGPVAVTDMDGDGDLDAFVGGRVNSGRYPLAADSMLIRSANGNWTLDTAAHGSLTNIGMVTAACWSDLNNDGFPELIIACEWGAIKVAQNNRGTLGKPAPLAGASDKLGWWNSVTTGDFNRDGKLDIVAGNWGRNTKYEAWRARPLRLYYPDLDGNSQPEIFEARFVPDLNGYAPWRGLDATAPVIPAIADRFRTHAAYARATIDQILGESSAAAPYLEANWLETTVFLNRGDQFEAVPLPVESLFAPTHGIAVADFDGDGSDDLFLAQNFFPVQPETTRLDGGRGLMLRGDGLGKFRSLSARESGVEIYGDQRAAAVSDFNGDARPDLVVAQNSAVTKLYRNALAKPGFRLRLQGPAGNPSGLGARVQLRAGGVPFITREVRAGAGYLAQDSAVLTFPRIADGAELTVTWPGGTTERHRVPNSGVEFTLKQGGAIAPAQ